MKKTTRIIGNTTINSFTPTNVDKEALKRVYDLLNDVANRLSIEKKDLFYTDEQVQKLKKDTRNTFL